MTAPLRWLNRSYFFVTDKATAAGTSRRLQCHQKDYESYSCHTSYPPPPPPPPFLAMSSSCPCISVLTVPRVCGVKQITTTIQSMARQLPTLPKLCLSDVRYLAEVDGLRGEEWGGKGLTEGAHPLELPALFLHDQLVHHALQAHAHQHRLQVTHTVTYIYICTHTHTHTHTCIHTQLHTCTHTHTHMYTHTVAYMYTHTCIHTQLQTCTHTHTHMYTHTVAYMYTHAHTHVYTHSCIHVHTRTHTCIHTQLHTCTHTHTHMYTHTVAYMYTHAHTHVYTHSCKHVHTCTHTCIHTQLQTCTHTHTHMYMGSSSVVVLIGSHSLCNSFAVNQFLYFTPNGYNSLCYTPKKQWEQFGGKKMFCLFFISKIYSHVTQKWRPKTGTVIPYCLCWKLLHTRRNYSDISSLLAKLQHAKAPES